jgi:hypothetical protein
VSTRTIVLLLVFAATGVAACGSDADAPTVAGSVAPPTAVAIPVVCPLTDAENVALSGSLFPTIFAGDSKVGITTATVGARNGSWVVADSIPRFAGLDLDMRPQPATAAGTLELTGLNDLRLVGGSAVLYPLAGFKPRDGDPPAYIGLDRVGVAVTPLPDGSVDLALPAIHGLWVLEYEVVWETNCLAGDGVAYLPIDTR